MAAGDFAAVVDVATGVSGTLTAVPAPGCLGVFFDGVSSTTILGWTEADARSEWIARRRLLRVGVASPSVR